MTISTATHDSIKRRRAIADVDDDNLNAELDALLSRQTANETRGRWFDLCFRLIILALAALWLLTPPAGGEHRSADEKAVATTR